MKILLSDTCLETASAAVAESKMLAYVQSHGEQPHSVMFPKLVEQVLDMAGCTFADIDGYACVHGPGSFTGVRIALTYSKAAAYASKKPLYLLNSLDVLAAGYNEDISKMRAEEKAILCIPMIDARNDEVFTAFYNLKNEKLTRYTDYEALHIDKVLEHAREQLDKNPSLRIALAGNAVKKHKHKFEEASFNLIPCEQDKCEHIDLNSALSLIETLEPVDIFTASPFYLRDAGAVRMRKR